MRTTLRQQIRIIIVLTALISTVVAGVLGSLWLDTPAGVVAVIVVSPVLGWLVGRYLSRRMTSPLEKLASSAASFASGNRTVRADTAGPREVRLIAEAFNRMADEVATALTQVRAEETRKTQFVSDVSHELRTPLTAIRGAAETLLDGGVSPDDQERFLSTIALEAERLTRLANDLLQLQRIEGATGEILLRQVDLRLAADRAAAMLEPLIEDRGVTLTVRGRAPKVLGDLDRLQQVVANLVDNASRIVGEGGSVTVELTSRENDVFLTVTDDGPGVPAEDLPKLFDRFYRADSSRARTSGGGAGLGLAIVRAIVHAHGGTIDAENKPGGGSRFVVQLPAAPQ